MNMKTRTIILGSLQDLLSYEACQSHTRHTITLSTPFTYFASSPTALTSPTLLTQSLHNTFREPRQPLYYVPYPFILRSVPPLVLLLHIYLSFPLHLLDELLSFSSASGETPPSPGRQEWPSLPLPLNGLATSQRLVACRVPPLR